MREEQDKNLELRLHSGCRQMLFVAGSRQVGKTTTARAALPEALYLNWDVDDDRALALSGQGAPGPTHTGKGPTA